MPGCGGARLVVSALSLKRPRPFSQEGLVAEWLRRGLQILAPRFDSGRGLQSQARISLRFFPDFSGLAPNLFRQDTLRRSVMRRLCGYQTVRLDDDNSGLAWQGIVDISYPIPAVPGLSLTADYRYFSTASRGVKGTTQQGAISAAGVVEAIVPRARCAPGPTIPISRS